MFRRKLLINLVIIFVCATVAVSVPIIVKHMEKSTNAASHTNWELTSTLIYNHPYDNLTWQVALKSQNRTIAWKDLNHSLFEYDTTHLQLTTDGFVCLNTKTTADYQALIATGYTPVVTYRGYQCVLKIN